MLFSKIINKKIITKSGKFVGYVKDVIINFKERKVEYISLVDINELIKEKNMNSLKRKVIRFNKILDVNEVVIVSD